ncbi:Gfo/Idh/MocA family oxidoreductase [Ramlibacter sp.]|uniref:Gfo/Idh/MocA family protein n=1 Tax=Ramlibacter sp. TaxID=1917967 RepID=UPI00263755A7|nr:Gfo/Idh/MocA family oxidoreductase [Ramlibacter sp.]MDB5957595.1 oxidoreductase protein [Ramlibacter sp.]
MNAKQDIHLAIVGCGRIGTLRGRLAAMHPAVRSIVVMDTDAAAADKLARTIGASFCTTELAAAISRPEINAIIVSSSEHEHTTPVIAALRRQVPVLVEKPIALTVADADLMLRTVQELGGNLRVGYSRRYKTRYLLAKEQLRQGRLGTITGACARLYNSRAQCLAMLGRNPHATPVVDALTYYVDLMGWLLEGNPVTEVFARGQKGVIQAAGYDTDDVTWAVLTCRDGAVVNLGVSYALPEKWPSVGHAARVELLGTDGVLLINDDHTDQIMHTNAGFPHVYLPGQKVETVFLESSTSGDWALGDFLGPLADETRAWLDELATGKPCNLATPQDARNTLAVTLAIEESARTGRVVDVCRAD